MNQQHFKKEVDHLLKQGKIQKALDFLSESISRKSPDLKEISTFLVMSYHKLSDINTAKRLGTRRPEELNREKAVLVKNIIDFVDDLKAADVRKPKANNKWVILFTGLFLAMVIAVVLVSQLKHSAPKTSPTTDLSGTVVASDRNTQAIKDLKFRPRIFSLIRCRYNKQDSLKAERLIKLYNNNELVKREIYWPNKWDIEYIWRGASCKYDIENNPSLNRITKVSELREVNDVFAEEKYKKIWLDRRFWDLKLQSAQSGELPINLIIMPPKRQLSVVVLEIEAQNVKNAQLTLNENNDVFTETIRKNIGNDFQIKPQDNKLIACLLLTERSDVLTFETSSGVWEFSLALVANPGFWRRPFDNNDDLIKLNYRFKAKG